MAIYLEKKVKTNAHNMSIQCLNQQKLRVINNFKIKLKIILKIFPLDKMW